MVKSNAYILIMDGSKTYTTINKNTNHWLLSSSSSYGDEHDGKYIIHSICVLNLCKWNMEKIVLKKISMTNNKTMKYIMCFLDILFFSWLEFDFFSSLPKIEIIIIVEHKKSKKKREIKFNFDRQITSVTFDSGQLDLDDDDKNRMKSKDFKSEWGDKKNSHHIQTGKNDRYSRFILFHQRCWWWS